MNDNDIQFIYPEVEAVPQITLPIVEKINALIFALGVYRVLIKILS